MRNFASRELVLCSFIAVAATFFSLSPALAQSTTATGKSTPKQCESAGFGESKSYNAVIYGDFEGADAHVVGRLAVKDNAKLTNYRLATGLNPVTAGTSVVVGGDLDLLSHGINAGNAIVGGRARVAQSVRSTLHPSQRVQQRAVVPVDFKALKNENRALSAQLAEFDVTGTASTVHKTLTLTGDGASSLQVFNATSEQLRRTRAININGVPADATIVLNVSGSAVTFRKLSMSGESARREHLVLNFPDARQFTIKESELEGNVLAPRAHVTAKKGKIYGTVMARSWTGTTRLKAAEFKGCFDIPAIETAPVALSLETITDEDTAVHIELQATDANNDALTFSVIDQPASGTLSGTAPALSYTPKADYNGDDTFTYQVSDGKLKSKIVSVLIEVKPVNDPPVANSQSLTTAEDSPLSIVLTGQDIDGDWFGYEIVSQPANGVLSGTAPNLTYTPEAGFSGTDTLEYIVRQSKKKASAPATIEIKVTATNDLPVADDQLLSVDAGVSLPITLTGSDADGDLLTFTITADPANGAVGGILPNIEYTPNQGFYGVDTIEFVANDGVGNSAIATVTIMVKQPQQTNRPPTITSPAIVNAEDGTPYSYDVQATDPDNEPLIYSLTQAPTGMTIDSSTGVISWSPTAEYIAHNTDDNMSCAVPQGQNAANAPSADVVIVIDESGSMDTEHGWVGEMGVLLDAHLVLNNIGSSNTQNQFGLIGYESSPRPLDVGNQTPMGNAADFYLAADQLRLTGGTEDGYRALKYAIDNLPFGTGSARNLILVTDEDRDVVSADTFESLKADIQASNFILNVAVNSRFKCGDDRPALGIAGNGLGLLADGTGGYQTCSGAVVVGQSDTTDADYIQLALEVGGAAWDLDFLRAGGLAAESFTNAFVEIKVKEIQQQLTAIPKPDLVVASVEVANGEAVVMVKNRGLADVTSTFPVTLELDGNAAGSQDVPSLAAGQTTAIIFPVSTNNASTVTATIAAQADECENANNSLSGPVVIVKASDAAGESDSQAFVISVSNVNQAPTITSAAEAAASVDAQYIYDIQVADQDVGDGFAFSLVTGPDGMTVDPIFGRVSFSPRIDQIGVVPVELKVTDLGGLSATQSFALTIDDSFISPEFTSEPPLRAIEGTTYTYQPTVDSDPQATLAFRKIQGPELLTVDASTGLVSWPIPAGAYGNETLVTISVQDQFGNYDIQAFLPFGDRPNEAPEYTSTPTGAISGTLFRHTLRVSDANYREEHTHSLTSGAPGMEVSTDGLFLWPASDVTSTHVGTFQKTNQRCWIRPTSLPSLDLKTKWINADYQQFTQTIVGTLFDSNNDLRLDDQDRRVIVGSSFRTSGLSGERIHAIDGQTGRSLWTAMDYEANREIVPAIGNLDGDTSNEVAYVDKERYLVVLNSDGTVRWRSQQVVADGNFRHNAVNIVDLENDGTPEILVGPSVFNATGVMLWQFPSAATTHADSTTSPPFAIDLDGDGIKEVLYYDNVRDINGNLLWNITHSDSAQVTRSTFFAAANFDADDAPEIVVSMTGTRGHRLKLIDNDGSTLWSVNTSSAGYPVIADFDRDGLPEIYLNSNKSMHDTDGSLIWQTDGSVSAYQAAHAGDIDGDGQIEILQNLSGGYGPRILDGATGAAETTAWISAQAGAAPIFVDLDGDGTGEIVTGSRAGIFVFESSDGKFAQGSKGLSQIHADARPEYWLTDNAYRLQAPAAPQLVPTEDLIDLQVSKLLSTDQGSPITLNVRAQNYGRADMTSAATIEFYTGTPSSQSNLLGTVNLTPLDSGDGVTISLPGIDTNSIGDEIFAVAVAAGDQGECHTSNNIVSSPVARLKITDHGGLEDTLVSVVDVTESTSNPALAAATPLTATRGELFTFQVTATDENSLDVVTFYLRNAPPGLSINATTGIIEWIPDANADTNQRFEVIALDSSQNAVARFYSVKVEDFISTNELPVISSQPPLIGDVGTPYLYTVTASDPEGGLVLYSLASAPANMSINHLTGEISWTPSTGDLGVSPVAIVVTDERGDTVEQNFEITTSQVANDPPVITSTPGSGVRPGVLYTYQVVAYDPDTDPITFELVTAPAGMTIDAMSGLVSWTPVEAQVGDQSVAVRAKDIRGASNTQTFTLTVRPAAVNNAPQITSTPSGVAKLGCTYSYSPVATDDDNDAVAFTLTAAPGGAVIDASNVISWTPNATGQVSMTLEASDTNDSVSQTWTVDVDDGSTPFAGNASATPAIANAGQLIAVSASPTGQAGDVSMTVEINGTSVPVDANGVARFSASTTPGTHGIVVTLTDGCETVVENLSYLVRDSSSTGDGPVLDIISPVSGNSITAPTEVVISVADDDLATWRLILRERGESSEIQIANGSGVLSNETVVKIDPSSLMNGQYDLVLQAGDNAGNTTQDSEVIVVEGDLKIGNFSISFEDLSIPLSGIPITITRTYDTRQRHKDLDFGYGWSIDYQNVKIDESRAPGRDWNLNRVTTSIEPNQPPQRAFCVQPSGQPIVSVTLPDGQVEQFEVKAVPECTAFNASIYVQMDFVALDGSDAELQQLDYGQLRLTNGHLNDIGGDPIADPRNYKLTTKDGFEYVLTQGVGVRYIIDPNGNRIDFTENGIIHSDGTTVYFQRDSEGRITDILDPNGNVQSYTYDSNGDLTAHTDAEGAKTTFAYNGNHGLVDITDPLGRRQIRNIYDNDGKLIAQEDADGNRTEFNHDLEGRESVITDRLGRVTVHRYDDRGNITSTVDALGGVTQYTYDADDNQLSMTDPLGNTTTATWDDRRNQLSQTDPLGNRVEFTYNQFGNELTVTDARGNTFENSHDNFGNLLSIKDPLGNIAGNSLNAKGLVSFRQDAEGNRTSFTYDNEGNKLTETDAEGVVTTYTYDDNGNQLSMSRPRSLADGSVTTDTTTYEYDKRDQLIKTTDALGNITRVEYDLSGREIAIIDALGRRTEMAYDTFGRLISTLHPDGTSNQSTYDKEGNQLTTTDRLGRVTTYTYDKLNRVTSIMHADGTTTRTEYDAAGRVTAEVDARGHRSTYEYDAAGRVVKVTDAIGNITTTVYDADGNAISVTDARGNTTLFTVDVLDRVTKTTFADGGVLETVYDKIGRAVKEIDQSGNETQFEYDDVGRLTTVTDAMGFVTSHAYDEAGNRITQTDAEGRQTSWAYDALGRQIDRMLPLGQIETMEYDAVGNLVSHTDFNGAIHTYKFDINDREIERKYADGKVETQTFDAVGNRIASSDETGNRTYAWDSMNRLLAETHANGTVLSYTYDENGNRLSLKVSHGVGTGNATSDTTTFAFDKLNRMSGVVDGQGRNTTYSYDAVGNRASMLRANGVYTEYVYDPVNRLKSMTHKNSANTVLESYTYTLDITGRRTGVTEGTGRVVTYGYDNNWRLVSESATDATNGNFAATYQYDKVGNRVYSTIDGVQTQYTYDANDRLLQQGAEIYSWDENGNTTRKVVDNKITNYAYDSRDRLFEMTEAIGSVNTTTTYFYDLDGNRNGKSGNGSTTTFVTDSNRQYPEVVEERDQNNTLIARYLHADDLVSQTRETGSPAVTHFPLTDGLGSSRTLSDLTGSLSDAWNYDAFGVELTRTGTSENPYQFAGEYFDSDLQQSYNRARHYDQKLGRFTQMDSWTGNVGAPITLNKYLYGNVDPMNNVDPSGYFSLASFSTASNIMGRLATTAIRFQSMADIFGALKDPNASGNDLGKDVVLSLLPTKYLKIFSKGCKNSFAEGTVVLTPTGLTQIQDLRIDDYVMTLNEKTLALEPKSVTNIISSVHTDPLTIVTTDSNEEIYSTSDHRFYTANSLTAAKDLEVGTQLVTANQKGTSVKSIISGDSTQVVFNLTVSDNHNYFVGETSALVHNVNLCKFAKGYANAAAKAIALRASVKSATKRNMFVGAFDATSPNKAVAAHNDQKLPRVHPTLRNKTRKILGADIDSKESREKCSRAGHAIGNCAEFHAANKILYKRAKWRNIYFTQPERVKHGHMEGHEACDNCKAMGFDWRQSKTYLRRSAPLVFRR